MNDAKMKKVILVAAAVCGMSIGADAAFMAGVTLTPSDPDIGDLDHSRVYTWGFRNFSIPEGFVISDAILSFDNINNWTAAENGTAQNPKNWLRLYLLDSANNPNRDGSEQGDAPTGRLTTYTDSDGGADSFLNRWTFSSYSHITTYSDYSGGSYGDVVDLSYSLKDLGLLGVLTSYIDNGNNFGLGFDPDCHYWNDGVKFEITYTPRTMVPDAGSSFLLLTLGLGALPVCKRFLRA